MPTSGMLSYFKLVAETNDLRQAQATFPEKPLPKPATFDKHDLGLLHNPLKVYSDWIKLTNQGFGIK